MEKRVGAGLRGNEARTHVLLFSLHPGDDPALSIRPSTNQTDFRTEPSEEDMGDKAPKRVKSIKKVPKTEVRMQGSSLGMWRVIALAELSPPSLYSHHLPRP